MCVFRLFNYWRKEYEWKHVVRKPEYVTRMYSYPDSNVLVLVCYLYVSVRTCMLLIQYSCHSCGAVVTFQRQPWHLGSCSVPTLDLWLNFDSSICIITPGPPNCGIGWRSSASHATSRHLRANLTKTFRDAVPSISITFKESLCAHFQRKCKCLPKEILLPAKYEFALTEEARLHRRHLLLKF